MDNHNKWAVVTGASSGIGYEIALALAKKGYHILAIARREVALQKLQSTIVNLGAECKYLIVDLAVVGAHKTVKDYLISEGIIPNVLVNNAGCGLYGEFMSQKPSDIEHMLMLNVQTLTMLTREVGELIPKGGHIMQVASTMCYVPVSQYSAYAATKSYVHTFGYALQAELGPDVSVTTLYPGMTETAFFERSHHQVATWLKRIMMYKPDYVAHQGVKAMLKRKPRVIAGMLNHFLVIFMHLTPDRINRWLLNTLFRIASR